jgi:hypothetical protein
VAPTLQKATRMSQLEVISDEVLSTVGGGARPPGRGEPDEDRPRTWGQVGREYGAACVQGAATLQGAATSLMFDGRPRSVRQAATTAAIGCAVGVGTKLIDDVTGSMAG